MVLDPYQRMSELCDEIRAEKDHAKFLQLVEEFDRLLDGEANILPKLPLKKGPGTSTAA